MPNLLRSRPTAKVRAALCRLWRWGRPRCSPTGLFIACQTISGFLASLSTQIRGPLSALFLAAALLCLLGGNCVVIWTCLDTLRERKRRDTGWALQLLALLLLAFELGFSLWIILAGLYHAW